MDSKIPENVKFAFEPLDPKLKDIYNKIKFTVNSICDNKIGFIVIVITTMELLEDIKINNKQKLKIATRCIIEIIQAKEYLNKEFIQTVPTTIQTVIDLSKGRNINREIKGLNITQKISITEQSVEKIITFIKNKNYDFKQILENIFIIITQIMVIVGKYPCLKGNQKKDIVIEVIKYIIINYKDDSVSNEFIETIFNSVPEVIDTFIKVNDNHFNINKKDIISCFACFK